MGLGKKLTTMGIVIGSVVLLNYVGNAFLGFYNFGKTRPINRELAPLSEKIHRMEGFYAKYWVAPINRNRFNRDLNNLRSKKGDLLEEKAKHLQKAIKSFERAHILGYFVD